MHHCKTKATARKLGREEGLEHLGHSYKRGKGGLTARVLGVISVARSRGPATDKGEAMRGLAELPWRPFAFHDGPPLAWEALGPNTLGVSFGDAAVDFDVSEDGRVVGAFASHRPRMEGKTVVETPWSGSFDEYRTFESLRVPTVAEVSWLLPQGPFTYWRGRVIEFRILR